MSKKKLESFRLGDIFEKLPVKKANKKDLSKVPTLDYCIPVVYAKNGDNGIMYWGKKGSFTTHSNVISIVYNGVISAGKAYAQERETGILAESYFIKLKGQKSIPFEALQYIAIVIEHSIYPKYSRDNLATWDNKVENEKIILPIKDARTKAIDYSYMKKEILSQKKFFQTRLHDFLESEKLSNTKLTPEEELTINTKPKTKQFKLGVLFKKINAPYKGSGPKQYNVSKTQNSEFSLPLVNCKNGDNGVMYYGRRKDFTARKNVLSIIYNGPPTEGQTYYQEEVGIYTDAYLIKLKSDITIDQELGLYLATAINNSIHNSTKKKYSRGNKATWENKVENDSISLPVDKKGNPDWHYMRCYIRALEKRVIQNIPSP